MAGHRASMSKQTAASGSVAQPKPLRILIMGGTNFLGPHVVREAVEQGHQVTIFNRGTRAAELPASVERLVGDRTVNLDAIKNRDWDAVIDVCAYVPRYMRSLGEALKGRVKHYTMISTISVYGVPAPVDATEDAPLLEYDGDEDPYSLTTQGQYYGAMKVLTEREAHEHFAGKLLILRPGYIIGPGEPGASITFHLARMQKGGEVLISEDPASPVQFIDVRDLAEWTLRLVAANTTGTFNAVGPSAPMTYGELLNTAIRTAGTSPKLTRVPPERLAARSDRSLLKPLLFWTSEKGGYGGSFQINSARAYAHGLRTRPLSDTCAEILKAYNAKPADEQIASRLWTLRSDNVWEATPMSWSTYLSCEKAVLSDWHAEVG